MKATKSGDVTQVLVLPKVLILTKVVVSKKVTLVAFLRKNLASRTSACKEIEALGEINIKKIVKSKSCSLSMFTDASLCIKV